MTVARPSAQEQLTFLAPSEAALVELVRQNLRLIAELRSTYQAAGGETNGRTVRSTDDMAALLAPEMADVTQQQLRFTCLSTYAQEAGPRLLVDALGVSRSQADRYQRFLAYRAEQAVADFYGAP